MLDLRAIVAEEAGSPQNMLKLVELVLKDLEIPFSVRGKFEKLRNQISFYVTVKRQYARWRKRPAQCPLPHYHSGSACVEAARENVTLLCENLKSEVSPTEIKEFMRKVGGRIGGKTHAKRKHPIGE